MSVTAIKAVLERSRAKGNERLVLLILAEAVNEKQVEAGLPWEAWPKQQTIARLANCEQESVRKFLRRLRAKGEIRDTGKRVARNIVVYELTLPDADQSAALTGEPGTGVPPNPGQMAQVPGIDGPGKPGTGVPPEPEVEPDAGTGHKEPDKAGRSAPALPRSLPVVGDYQLEPRDFEDMAAILERFNELNGSRWKLLGPKGDLTQHGRVLFARYEEEGNLTVDDFIDVVENNFAGEDPPCRYGAVKSAAAIFSLKAWRGASVYRPEVAA